jgi:hypothetical protein
MPHAGESEAADGKKFPSDLAKASYTVNIRQIQLP